MTKRKNDSSKLGMNRTGIKASPKDGPRMIEGAETLTVAWVPEDAEGSFARMMVRGASMEGTMGSVPPPASAKGMLKTAAKMLGGRDPTLLIDKLGARIAFERTGVRLYDAALVKLAATGSWEGGPDEAGLRHIREEELAHFEMLCACMESLGGDPTAMTPAANTEAMASEGVVKLLSDPRSSLSQALEGLLVAELADNDGWMGLIHLARAMGHHDFVQRFEQAQLEEEEHLRTLRSWMQQRLADASRFELEQAPPG